MENKAETTKQINTKIENINDSINLMVDCVKHLEKIRSYNYMASVEEKELQNVLCHLQKIEESIDKIKQPSNNKEASQELIKAVGKNKKLWVSRQNVNNPVDNNHRRLPEPKFVCSSNLTKNSPTREKSLEGVTVIKKH